MCTMTLRLGDDVDVVTDGWRRRGRRIKWHKEKALEKGRQREGRERERDTHTECLKKDGKGMMQKMQIKVGLGTFFFCLQRFEI